MGALQRVVGERNLEGFGEAIVARLEGALIHQLQMSAQQQDVFEVLVAPIMQWAMPSLVPVWMLDLGASPRSAGAGRAYDIIMAFHEKYQHLNPRNN